MQTIRFTRDVTVTCHGSAEPVEATFEKGMTLAVGLTRPDGPGTVKLYPLDGHQYAELVGVPLDCFTV